MLRQSPRSIRTATLFPNTTPFRSSAFSARPSYDILVNNAGTNRPIPFLNVEPDDFDAVCSLNVRAAFFVAQVVARGMVETGRGGSIIHMSSQMGHVGGARRTLYCASKWAVEGQIGRANV